MGPPDYKKEPEAPAILFLRSDLILDPISFSHFPASAKIRSDLKRRSDLKNKIAGASDNNNLGGEKST